MNKNIFKITKYTLPCGGFFFYPKGYHREVMSKLSPALKKRYYILKQGDKIQID